MIAAGSESVGMISKFVYVLFRLTNALRVHSGPWGKKNFLLFLHSRLFSAKIQDNVKKGRASPDTAHDLFPCPAEIMLSETGVERSGEKAGLMKEVFFCIYEVERKPSV